MPKVRNNSGIDSVTLVVVVIVLFSKAFDETGESYRGSPRFYDKDPKRKV